MSFKGKGPAEKRKKTICKFLLEQKNIIKANNTIQLIKEIITKGITVIKYKWKFKHLFTGKILNLQKILDN